MRFKLILLLFVISFKSALAQVVVQRDLNYAGGTESVNTLNIYHQKDITEPQDVIVFIHGGSWSSGKKETYWWLGRNLVKHKVVAVIINYPLAPNATYKEMAIASAKAVKWVQDSIAYYGGNPKRLFLMGHSAGAHLAELINADTQYFKALGISNPIKGVILNDAFGLDMDEYLSKAAQDDKYTDFLRTFSTKQENWQLGSPLFYVKSITNPHFLLYGAQTYPAIQLQTERFNQLLMAQNVKVQMEIIPKKKHVGMISQMVWKHNKVYGLIADFLARTQ